MKWTTGCWDPKTLPGSHVRVEDEQTKAPTDENNLPAVQNVDRLSRNSHQDCLNSKVGPSPLIYTILPSGIPIWNILPCFFFPLIFCNRGPKRKNHMDGQSFLAS